MQISFDPGRQASLGDQGTVMVTGDWREVWAPLDTVTLIEGTLDAPRRWSGIGWTLTLPQGWTFRRDGASWRVEPRAR